ncbi:uncharacterized protein LOC119980308 [Tripterygium wilfordii]|uniref:uncharacterized protein LOC119980308 n=1 Tax=Tripterygium wilfordii TaxID=458696 RepID=UPI0018F8483E|nr:uncharacterized protein LOC119980308 [Tripterygium wilfordii]
MAYPHLLSPTYMCIPPREINRCKVDENYGFRAPTGLLGYDNNAWANVQQDLIGELRIFWGEYVDLFGDYERVFSIHNPHIFFETEGPTPLENWMSMPDMCHLIASKYNVALHLFSYEHCLPFLPLHFIPPPGHECITIAIRFVNGNHFVQLALTDDYLMPPTMIQWFRYRYDFVNE